MPLRGMNYEIGQNGSAIVNEQMSTMTKLDQLFSWLHKTEKREVVAKATSIMFIKMSLTTCWEVKNPLNLL